MSEVIRNLSQKRYNELKNTIITDAIDVALESIAKHTNIENKDKSYTTRKLTTTIDLMIKLISESNNDKIPSDIKTIKPKISPNLNKTFCYKAPSKTDNIKEISDEIPKIMNITPIGEEYPVKEEEKYQTPSGKNEQNSSNKSKTPTPSPPPIILPEQINNQNSDKINSTTIYF